MANKQSTKTETPHSGSEYSKTIREEEEGQTRDKLEEGQTREKLLEELYNILKSRGRVKRMISMVQAEFNVEMVFLLDYSVYKYWLHENNGNHKKAIYDLKYFYTHVFHGIYTAYKSISFDKYQITVTPWLKEIRITTSSLESWFTENAKISTSKILLDRSEDNIRSYMDQQGFTWANPDIVLMWSRYTFVLGSKDGLLGLAGDICSVCKKGKGIAQCYDYGLFSWMTGAHEAAHVLGAMHDRHAYGCPPIQKYIMTPYSIELEDKTYKNAFQFSWCSVEMMKRCFRGLSYGGVTPSFPRTCVYDTVCWHGQPIQDDLSELPGQKYNLVVQCQLSMGKLSATYDKNCNIGNNICMSMTCKIDGTCTNNGNNELRAGAGTPCDINNPYKVCYQGDCVEISTINYAQPLDSSSCSTSNKVPTGCQDTHFTASDEMDCEQIAVQFPWKCYTMVDVREHCKATCFKWGLIRIANPLCNFTELEISVQNDLTTTTITAPGVPQYVNKLKFTYCGYTSGSWYIQCPNLPTRCIPMRYVCDGTDDCPDGADEERLFCFKVPSGVNDTAGISMVRCPGDPHQLIPETWLCNGHGDCTDDKDEDPNKCDPFKYCNHGGTEVSCPNNPRLCVPVKATCDGVEDCGPGEQAGDENVDFCPTLCPPGQVRCPHMSHGSECIYGQWACDGHNDCGEGDDEDSLWCESLLKNKPIDCPQYKGLLCVDRVDGRKEHRVVRVRIKHIDCPQYKKNCPEAGHICISEGFFCDGVDDCPERGDELNCPAVRELSVQNIEQRLEDLISERNERLNRHQHKGVYRSQVISKEVPEEKLHSISLIEERQKEMEKERNV